MLFEWQKFEAMKLSLFGFSLKSGLHSLTRVCFGFASLRLVIGWKKKKKNAPLSRLLRTKTNHDSLAHIFQCFTSAACVCSEFWLDKGIVCSLWLVSAITLAWFYDTLMKSSSRYVCSILEKCSMSFGWASTSFSNQDFGLERGVDPGNKRLRQTRVL